MARHGVKWIGWWVPLGVAAAVAAPLLAHVAISTGRFAGAASALSLVALLSAAAQAAARLGGAARWSVLAVAAAMASLLAARLAWPGLGLAGLVATAGIAHAIVYLSLLAWFGQSLRPGRVPIVSALSRRMRGTLSPAVAAYTRNVTRAWCGVFLLQLAGSALLALTGPRWAWSLWVNVVDVPVLVVAFAVEYAVRLWRLRDERHAAPAAVLRGFARMWSGER